MCYISLTLYQTTKNIDLFKLKAFTEDNSNVAQIMEPFFDMVENIARNRENAGYQNYC